MNPRKHTTSSRVLALTTATLFAIGGGMATTATAGAQEEASDLISQDIPNGDEAARIAADLTPNIGISPWTDMGAATQDYDPYQSLSAITLDVEQATGGSPRQVALFAGSKYIGTTTPEAYPYQTTERVADNIIKVNYHYLLPGDSNAAPSGEATSYYILLPQGIERVGSLPPHGGVPPVE
jgi:hypothetical protein